MSFLHVRQSAAVSSSIEEEQTLCIVTASMSAILYKEMNEFIHQYPSCSVSMRLQCWNTECHEAFSSEFHPPTTSKFTTVEYSSQSLLSRFGLFSGYLLFGASPPFFRADRFCKLPFAEKLVCRICQIVRRARGASKSNGLVLNGEVSIRADDNSTLCFKSVFNPCVTRGMFQFYLCGTCHETHVKIRE